MYHLLFAALQPVVQPPAPAPAPAAPAQLVAFPHPLITEVLYAVPTGDAGDANKDGSRDVNGDEFVELINPHDKVIQLKGYMLTDRNPEDKGKLRFTFPALELQPGQIVVVFNGHGARWTGPVGDSSRAPEAGNETFAGAFTFTMKITSAQKGFSNSGDYVLLTAPSNEPIHCVTWGTYDEKPPASTALIEEAPKVTGRSVTRPAPTGGLEPHDAAFGPFSPGVFPYAAPAPSADPAR